jgi:hypothetical protein
MREYDQLLRGKFNLAKKSHACVAFKHLTDTFKLWLNHKHTTHAVGVPWH